MSELNVYHHELRHNEYDEFYLKYEADKVIAELKEKRDTAEKLLNKALDCVSDGKNHMMSLARKKNHADYKRCLAMVKYCHESAMWLEEYGVTKSATFMLRWHKRWLKIAEKFKEAK